MKNFFNKVKDWFKKAVNWFKNIEWNKRIGKSDKGTSDYVKPVIAWSAFGGSLVLATALFVIITLAV